AAEFTLRARRDQLDRGLRVGRQVEEEPLGVIEVSELAGVLDALFERTPGMIRVVVGLGYRHARRPGDVGGEGRGRRDRKEIAAPLRALDEQDHVENLLLLVGVPLLLKGSVLLTEHAAEQIAVVAVPGAER